MKKTPWFSAATPPVHEGPYECRYDATGHVCIRVFESAKWRTPWDSFCSFGWSDADQWRGLTEQAKDQT